jgi:predicted glycosyltransferase
MIWIDLANSPHVQFFMPLIDEFRKRGFEVALTARDFSQTIGLLRLHKLQFDAIGRNEGRTALGKLFSVLRRSLSLRKWARGRSLDLAISHNSYAQVVAARLLGIPAVTLMDYEHHPGNHIAFKLAKRVIVPKAFSSEALERFSVREEKIRRYDGLKEEVYLHDFIPDPRFQAKLYDLFTASGGDYSPDEHVLLLVRPPADMSVYHRFRNPLFENLLKYVSGAENTRIILLPRTEKQREELAGFESSSLVMPVEPLEGKNAVWHADAVISAGGTMCREAAAMGVPSFSIFWGTTGGVDSELVDRGELVLLTTEEDFKKIPREPGTKMNRKITGPEVKNQVVSYCLSVLDIEPENDES